MDLHVPHAPLYGDKRLSFLPSAIGKVVHASYRDRAMQLLVPMLFWCSLLESLKFIVFPRSTGAPDTALQFLNELVGTYWFVWAAFICFCFR